MTYAVGRNLKASDMPAVRAAVREAAGKRHAFSAVVLATVKSAPFQKKLKAPEPPSANTSVAGATAQGENR
jgi:hypothetical protein